jgi:hypothetical protein
MLDYDLAALYEVPTKVLNQAVKRTADRFPEDFMFRLTESEKRRKTYLPYAFTEHGVTMLASVLKSQKAVKMSIEVVRTYDAIENLLDEKAAQRH